jgi:hypothetical protein
LEPWPLPKHDWKAGRKRLSSRPRIEFYPNFVSPAEVDYLLRLGLVHATPTSQVEEEVDWSKAAGRPSAIVFIPPSIAEKDPVVAAIDKRCTKATGVPMAKDEAPLVMRHSAPAVDGAPGAHSRMTDSLHVDTRAEARQESKPFRCVTVTIYLNTLEPGFGGETRFPLADIDEDSPLLSAASRALEQGYTTVTANMAGGPAEFRWLHDAADDPKLGVHVQPQRGAACVHWTMNERGPIIHASCSCCPVALLMLG